VNAGVATGRGAGGIILRTAVAVAAGLLVVAVGALALGSYRWQRGTDAALARLRDAPGRAAVARYTAAELAGLPAPVQRYFHAVLREGQRIPTSARIEHEGTFLLRPPSGWRPFRSTEHLVSHPPGFLWDAGIQAAPGLVVRVRDASIGGVGSMRASLLGILPVAAVEGTPDLAQGALLRWLAEAAWMPTALLPSAGILWLPLDDSTARATVSVAGVSVWLDFHFGADSLITSTFTRSRGRDVNGVTVPTPWEGRFTDYQTRGGMRVPVRGEVAWLLPQGRQAYWRGRITGIAYDAGPSR
jgi:hypothetical protein